MVCARVCRIVPQSIVGARHNSVFLCRAACAHRRNMAGQAHCTRRCRGLAYRHRRRKEKEEAAMYLQQRHLFAVTHRKTANRTDVSNSQHRAAALAKSFWRKITTRHGLTCCLATVVTACVWRYMRIAYQAQRTVESSRRYAVSRRQACAGGRAWRAAQASGAQATKHAHRHISVSTTSRRYRMVGVRLERWRKRFEKDNGGRRRAWAGRARRKISSFAPLSIA